MTVEVAIDVQGLDHHEVRPEPRPATVLPGPLWQELSRAVTDAARSAVPDDGLRLRVAVSCAQITPWLDPTNALLAAAHAAVVRALGAVNPSCASGPHSHLLAAADGHLLPRCWHLVEHPSGKAVRTHRWHTSPRDSWVFFHLPLDRDQLFTYGLLESQAQYIFEAGDTENLDDSVDSLAERFSHNVANAAPSNHRPLLQSLAAHRRLAVGTNLVGVLASSAADLEWLRRELHRVFGCAAYISPQAGTGT